MKINANNAKLNEFSTIVGQPENISKLNQLITIRFEPLFEEFTTGKNDFVQAKKLIRQPKLSLGDMIKLKFKIAMTNTFLFSLQHYNEMLTILKSFGVLSSGVNEVKEEYIVNVSNIISKITETKKADALIMDFIDSLFEECKKAFGFDYCISNA